MSQQWLLGKLCDHELSATRSNQAESGQVPWLENLSETPGWTVRARIPSNLEILGFSWELDNVSGKLSQWALFS